MLPRRATFTSQTKGASASPPSARPCVMLQVDDAQNIAERVLENMKCIEERRRGGTDGTTLPPSLPVVCYHIFTYKKYECWLLRLSSMHEKWVGVIREPVDNRLIWPAERAFGKRPFAVGIDIDIASDDARTHLVGFHTSHLQDLTSFDGVRTANRSVDYIVDQLREYIDTCLAAATSSVSTAKKRRKR